MLSKFFRRTAKRSALIQFASDKEYGRQLDMTFGWHQQYCRRHRIDYVTSRVKTNPDPMREKMFLLQRGLEAGYDSVIWLDTDCIIVKPEFDLSSLISFGIGVCECFDSPHIFRHLNIGVMFAANSPETREFFKVWIDHPPGDMWADQSPFNELMAHRPWRDILTILPNRFNCLDEHMEARDPVVRAWHGDPNRDGKMAAVMNELQASTATL